MLEAQKPAIARDIPGWVPLIASFVLLALIGGAILTTAVFVKVLAGALMAVMAYLAIHFACHAVATVRSVTDGLGAIFQSWRP